MTKAEVLFYCTRSKCFKLDTEDPSSFLFIERGDCTLRYKFWYPWRLGLQLFRVAVASVALRFPH